LNRKGPRNRGAEGAEGAKEDKNHRGKTKKKKTISATEDTENTEKDNKHWGKEEETFLTTDYFLFQKRQCIFPIKPRNTRSTRTKERKIAAKIHDFNSE
jgi:hypothetical protein